MELTPELLSAVRELKIETRGDRWTSLTYCVLDAVWSIGIGYSKHVVPAVRRVADVFSDPSPTAPHDSFPRKDLVPLSKFLERFPEPQDLVEVTTKHRTSSRSGILKADASIRYARVLNDAGIVDLESASAAIAAGETDRVSRELRAIPGDGVRTGYFWMLVGDDQGVKPDRMILRFLRRYVGDVSVSDARVLVTALAAELSDEASSSVTPWMIDHAIWTAESRK